jgi:hypothetical protein
MHFRVTGDGHREVSQSGASLSAFSDRESAFGITPVWYHEKHG